MLCMLYRGYYLPFSTRTVTEGECADCYMTLEGPA